MRVAGGASSQQEEAAGSRGLEIRTEPAKGLRLGRTLPHGQRGKKTKLNFPRGVLHTHQHLAAHCFTSVPRLGSSGPGS